MSPLAKALVEASALGARFRLSGAEVVIDKLEQLPKPLAEVITADRKVLFEHLRTDAEREADLATIEIAATHGARTVFVDDVATARRAVRTLIRDLRRNGGLLAVDIETMAPDFAEPAWLKLTQKGEPFKRQPSNGKDKNSPLLCAHRGQIATIQLYAGSICFVLRGAAKELVGRSHWLRRQHLIAHNAVFETKFLMQLKPHTRLPKGRHDTGKLECTLQAAGLMLGTWRRGIDDAGQAYLDLKLPKAHATSDWGAAKLTKAQVAYAAMDAVVAYRLWPTLEARLRREKRFNTYTLQRNAIPAVAAMELRGFLLDVEEHAAQTEGWARELAEARRSFKDATKKIAPENPAAIREWLTELLPGELMQRWPTTSLKNELSTKSDHLERLITWLPNREAEVKAVLTIIAKAQLLENFGASLASKRNPITHRWHPSYNIGSNPNAQQFPAKRDPKFRKSVVAEPGYLLVGCDFSQIELRAAASLSGDAAMTRIYEEGGDIHAETAALFAGVSPEHVTKAQRDSAKPINFGAVYGIGAAALVEYAWNSYGQTISLQEAQNRIDRFFTRFHELKSWLEDNYNRSQARGYVRIGNGRVVKAEWEKYGLSYNQCCNLPIQGIAADAMLRAIPLAHRRFLAAGIKGGLIMTVHDELLAEVAEEHADLAKQTLEQSMRDAFIATFPGAPTHGVAEAAIGRTWAEIKSVQPRNERKSA
jgi:DNA polymerase-1